MNQKVLVWGKLSVCDLSSLVLHYTCPLNVDNHLNCQEKSKKPIPRPAANLEL